MARPRGSKVIACTCGKKIVARIGEVGTCKSCGARKKFTLRLMKILGKPLS